MQSRIKERCKKFLDGITLQLQQEKEDMIQEGRQKILEEIELQLEDIHVKYDGIISKAISIKIKHRGYKVAFYLIKKKIDDMGMQNGGKSSNETISTPLLPREFASNIRMYTQKIPRKEME